MRSCAGPLQFLFLSAGRIEESLDLPLFRFIILSPGCSDTIDALPALAGAAHPAPQQIAR